MKPENFPKSNRVLGAPKGMEDNCEPLYTFTDGQYCVSKWRPSWRDRLRVLIGAPLWLWVVSGDTQPPVMIETVNPWDE